jgi:hypothetical protein
MAAGQCAVRWVGGLRNRDGITHTCLQHVHVHVPGPTAASLGLLAARDEAPWQGLPRAEQDRDLGRCRIVHPAPRAKPSRCISASDPVLNGSPEAGQG